MAEQPVLVIGLDGATFDIVRPWAEAGIMPHIHHLLKQGVSSVLVSTTPPLTGPAWSSFATGNHPGKHGNLDFYIIEGDYTLHPISARTIRGWTLWDILSRAGKRVGIVNVPITYPPRPVNGLMVSGLMTPSLASDFTFPPELREEIIQRWPDYSFAVPWRDYEGRVEDLLTALRYTTKQRRDLVLYCMEREEWDFFMAVFVGMDRVQHCLWRFMDPEHPTYDVKLAARYLPLIQDYYQFLDAVVGEIISAAPEQANIILMSDHGFGPLWKEVDLNRWLADKGLLAYRSQRHRVTSQIWRVGRQVVHAIPALQRMFRHRYGKRLRQGMWEATFSSAIDWLKTRVYSYAHGGLFINLRGRESQGIVRPDEYEALRDELIELLQDMVDPETGQRIIYRAQRREEVYSGPALSTAPDVIVTEADERYYLGFTPTPNLRFLEKTHWKSGYHRYEGILIASGPGFQAGRKLEKASIVDLMPTILYLLDVPIPGDIDGQVLEDMLNEKLLASRSPAYYAADEGENNAGVRLDKKDETVLIERLRSLGYL